MNKKQTKSGAALEVVEKLIGVGSE